MIEAELVSANSHALSFDCDREAATIEPLVRGQQLITPFGAGDGSVNSLRLLPIAGLAACFEDDDPRLALQHACASIANIDIECSAVGIDEFSSPIARA